MRLMTSIKAGACALALFAAASPALAATACPKTVSDAERLMAVNAVSNLMGRYSHDFARAGLGGVADIFALETPGLSWKVPQGPDGAALVALFKGAQGRPHTTKGGSLHIHAMFSPTIEVAADGKTAIGVWDSYGPNIGSIESTSWEWNKYGVDFVKENGVWKVWHLRAFPMFLIPSDKSITETAKANAEKAANAALLDTEGRPGWTGPSDPLWTYDGKTPMRGPKAPAPYCTYAPALSAAQYAKD